MPWQVLLTKGLELVSKEKFRVGPVMDGVLIKESPMKSLREGRVDAGIREYVIGCNKDEVRKYFLLMVFCFYCF